MSKAPPLREHSTYQTHQGTPPESHTIPLEEALALVAPQTRHSLLGEHQVIQRHDHDHLKTNAELGPSWTCSIPDSVHPGIYNTWNL